MRFLEAINQFSSWRTFSVKPGTVRGYDRELRNFCLFLRNPEVERITITDVMEYLNGMRQLGWDENTFVPKGMALRKFFEFCGQQGLRVLEASLIPVPPKTYRIPRVADEQAYRKLLGVIPRNNDPRHIRNLAIVNFLWDTGARNGEIVSLNVGDVDCKSMRTLIATEKSRGRRPFREIFWTRETNDNLGRWLTKREELKQRMTFHDPEALFLSICSSGVHRRSGWRFNQKGILEMLRRYANKAKIPYLNAHSFRHHLGHHIIERGGSASDVMNILGHASLLSSSIYTMMTDRELQARYRKLKNNRPLASQSSM